MESRVKLFGHPIHPMLIVFPIGLLSTSVLFDLFYLVFRKPILTIVSYYMIISGIVGGLLAAVFGLIDWLALPLGTRAKNIGGWHGLGNFAIVLQFMGSWFLRRRKANHAPPTSARLLSLMGFGLALVTSWIGGELVYRLGVGVDRGANVNAPSSLQESPAARTIERMVRS